MHEQVAMTASFPPDHEAGEDPRQTRERLIQLGFDGDEDRFCRFVELLRDELPPDAGVIVRGSAIAGSRWADGAPFDADGKGSSDLDVTFIGATTENPSFELNNALLSRARVYVLKALDEDALLQIVRHALERSSQAFDSRIVRADEDALRLIVAAADGDARRALNLVELAADLAPEDAGEQRVDLAIAEAVATGGRRRFDKKGEYFYDQISALHKSIRGSDPDASLYWLMRMLDGGCDPLYISRRMVRVASEDIGNADPRALRITLDAWDALERLGSPEGELALAQAVVFLACAAKSNAVYKAANRAMADARESGSLEVPMHLRNAPTRLMKELGYGKGYRYAHDEQDAFAAGETYFPDDMPPRRYYDPVPRGLELKIREKLARNAELTRRSADDKRKGEEKSKDD